MIGCWPPSRSRGSGLSLTVDERLEEVSICGRQSVRPNGHRLHMPLERISSLMGVLYGVVEHVSWSRRPRRTSARRGASPQRVLSDQDLLMMMRHRRQVTSGGCDSPACGPCALKTRGLPLGHRGRALEAKVARRALPGSEGHVQRDSLLAGQREVQRNALSMLTCPAGWIRCISLRMLCSRRKNCVRSVRIRVCFSLGGAETIQRPVHPRRIQGWHPTSG